ncbi:SMP-30/gluconolactonase/LRE family protein [Paenibacillus bovis]|uniref:SMP-30/gluconolaconase/LRE domain protein n=1 Tax=Paenibacillus bovis TaxID=1616788 RepID=A0A172ZFQ6_9BACL|nr:SMP-30/gluconolactonase/LRE family protein [Paenibacillus bovis]ANF96465.1 SMP-30/gluconolaconase/LRE domain protein [Paenibacillus bovis]
MKQYTAELIIDARAKLGEGPSWNAEQQRLLWVDIEGYQLHIYNPVTKEDRTVNVGEHIGAVVPYTDTEVIGALFSGLYRIQLSDGSKTLIHDPEEGRPGNRFNDGKCDPVGRFLAGTMSLNGEEKQGALYSMDTTGHVRLLLGEVSTSNGLAWSSDHRTLYYIDTPTCQITAFDYDLEDGSIANGRAVAELDDSDGYPDGMTIDEEGMLWVARWGGSRVTRIDPSTGQVIGEVHVPAKCVTACTFGGADLDELYITTAREDDEAADSPAGGVFVVRPGVKGIAAYTFNQGKAANWQTA